jgi:methanogenic corrinoid protein MtbC1
MRQLPLPDESWPGESWNEAEAMGLLRRMGRRERHSGHARAVADNSTPLHAAPGAARARQAALLRTVQEEVIPRLLRSHQPAAAAEPQGTLVPKSFHVEALAQLSLVGSQIDVTLHVEALVAAGMAVEALLLDVIAPAARRLGAMWDCDDCDFSGVTMGVLRLSRAVESLGYEAGEHEAGSHDAGRRGVAESNRPCILLAQAPGGQHGLGLAVLSQFFGRARWYVRCETNATAAHLASIVRQNWFGVVGLSVACTEQTENLPGLIRELRRASCNRDLGIMVGGAAFAADPELAGRMGADATATDGQNALIEAQHLMTMIARPR